VSVAVVPLAFTVLSYRVLYLQHSKTDTLPVIYVLRCAVQVQNNAGVSELSDTPQIKT